MAFDLAIESRKNYEINTRGGVMKFIIGFLIGGLFSTSILLTSLYLTFPTQKVLQKWTDHDGRGISLELREGEILLNIFPWERQGYFSLVGPDGRDRLIPVRIYLHDIDTCIRQCKFIINGKDFILKLPRNGQYSGRIDF